MYCYILVKQKKKFFPTFSHLFLAIKNVERFSLAVSYFRSFILSLRVSLFVLLCITLLQFLCVLLLMKKLKPNFPFSLFFVLIINYRIFFHIKIKQRSISYFDVVFLSCGKAICIDLWIICLLMFCLSVN
jgi:hypothetical protein